MTESIAPAPVKGRDLGDIYGLRTFRSEGFRVVVAATLALFGVLMSILFFVVLWGGDPPWSFDFQAYYAASARMLDGGSPYLAAQLEAPVDAVCDGCYLYPPLLAQALAPLALLPIPVAKLVWFVVTTVAALAATWFAAGVGGAPRSLERLLWCIVATTFFVPTFHANYYGNVGSLVALGATAVAMGGMVAGTGAALTTLLKVTPGAWAPAVLVAGPGPRRAFVLVLAASLGVAFILAPGAWLEYPTVFLNMLRGSTDYTFNLALANVAAQLGWPDAAVTLVRVASLALGALALGVSVVLARRPAGLPSASVAGGVVILLVPATIWGHYFTILLPFAAMAWPAARPAARILLLAGAALVVVFGLGQVSFLPHLGTAILVITALWVLWPRTSAHVERERPMVAQARPWPGPRTD
jgi:hypothetical protein